MNPKNIKNRNSKSVSN
jgi:hypothetical protein